MNNPESTGSSDGQRRQSLISDEQKQKMGEMKDKLKDKINTQLGDVDKQKLKDNAKQGWTKFITFVEDFTDKIFISVLIGVGIWNLLRLFLFGDDETKDVITINAKINTIVVIYMFMFAGLIFILMNEEDPRRVLIVHYAAFLEDDYGRVFFLLFTAMFTFPMDGSCQMDKGCTNNSWANWVAGSFLSTAAVINIIKIFKQKKASRLDGGMDPHPQMEEGQVQGERKINFIDADFAKHENGESIQASNDFVNAPILNPTYDSSLLDDDEEEPHYQEEQVNQVQHNQEQTNYKQQQNHDQNYQQDYQQDYDQNQNQAFNNQDYDQNQQYQQQ